MADRAAREEELKALLPDFLRVLDLSHFSDTELNGIISILGRKTVEREERGEQPRRRARRR